MMTTESWLRLESYTGNHEEKAKQAPLYHKNVIKESASLQEQYLKSLIAILEVDKQ
jgi:hypothetical protein